MTWTRSSTTTMKLATCRLRPPPWHCTSFRLPARSISIAEHLYTYRRLERYLKETLTRRPRPPLLHDTSPRLTARSISGAVHFYANRQVELYASKEAHRLTLRQLVRSTLIYLRARSSDVCDSGVLWADYERGASHSGMLSR